MIIYWICEDYNLDSINKWKKNKANRWFNRKYGFGILQADKLLENAEGFTSLGNYDDRKIIEYDHSFTNKTIEYLSITDNINSNNSTTSSNKLYEYTINNTISNYNLNIESVMIDVTTNTSQSDKDNIAGLVFLLSMRIVMVI